MKLLLEQYFITCWCWGSMLITNFLLSMQPRISQDLSMGNTVTISWRLVTYLVDRTRGLRSRTSRWWWSRRSWPQGHVDHDVATTLAQQPGATKGSTFRGFIHIRWMMTTSGSLIQPRLRKYIGLDQIQNSCSMTVCSGGVVLASMQPFGEPHERERREREGRRMGRRGELLKGTPLNLLCALLLPRGLPYIGEGAPLPPTEAPLGRPRAVGPVAKGKP
jgi:hypothetical protein